MKRPTILAMVAIAVVVIGLTSGLAIAASARVDKQTGNPPAIKITDSEQLNVVDVQPVAAKRQGETKRIDSQGKHTMKSLGYADLRLQGKDRFQAVSAEYDLPDDAMQGRKDWYTLNLNLQIEFSEQSTDGECEVIAYANGCICTTFHFYSSTENGTLVITCDDYPVSSLVANINYSGYLPSHNLFFNPVQPGRNFFTILLGQYYGMKVNSITVDENSSIERISVAPPGYERQVAMRSYLPKLSQDEETRAREIALSDATLQQLVAGKGSAIDLICEWDLPQAAGKEARVDVSLDRVYRIEYDWPWPPVPIRKATQHFKCWVSEMTVVVSLDEGKILGIMPERHPIMIDAEDLPPELRPAGYVSQPKPQIPELTESEKAEAKAVALSDSRVQMLLEGKDFEFAPDSGVGLWQSSKLEKIGAVVEIQLDRPYWIGYDWPTVDYDEQKYYCPYYVEATATYRESWVDTLMISINLEDGRVVEIAPLEAPAGS
jgi:hypothetical protein